MATIAAGVPARSVRGVGSCGDFGAGRAAVGVVKVGAEFQLDVVVLDEAVLSGALPLTAAVS